MGYWVVSSSRGVLVFILVNILSLCYLFGKCENVPWVLYLVPVIGMIAGVFLYQDYRKVERLRRLIQNAERNGCPDKCE